MPDDWLVKLLNKVYGSDENIIGADLLSFDEDTVTFVEIRRVGEGQPFAIVDVENANGQTEDST